MLEHTECLGPAGGPSMIPVRLNDFPSFNSYTCITPSRQFQTAIFASSCAWDCGAVSHSGLRTQERKMKWCDVDRIANVVDPSREPLILQSQVRFLEKKKKRWERWCIRHLVSKRIQRLFSFFILMLWIKLRLNGNGYWILNRFWWYSRRWKLINRSTLKEKVTKNDKRKMILNERIFIQ